ncbi:MAG: hypothetical protein R3E68_03780 [Burkholderiaceae bacterium]
MPTREVDLDGRTVAPVTLQHRRLHAVVGRGGCAIKLQANQQRLHLAAKQHVQRPGCRAPGIIGHAQECLGDRAPCRGWQPQVRTLHIGQQLEFEPGHRVVDAGVRSRVGARRQQFGLEHQQPAVTGREVAEAMHLSGLQEQQRPGRHPLRFEINHVRIAARGDIDQAVKVDALQAPRIGISNPPLQFCHRVELDVQRVVGGCVVPDRGDGPACRARSTHFPWCAHIVRF